MSTEVKVCGKCKQTKLHSEFNSRKNGKFQPFCKNCNSEYGRDWHQRNKVKRQAVLAEQKKARKKIVREYVWKLLKERGCADCPENDPIVLDFDHISNKEYNISKMIQGGYILESVISEIEKCEIRCSNCHRRKTAKQFGWFRLD